MCPDERTACCSQFSFCSMWTPGKTQNCQSLQQAHLHTEGPSSGPHASMAGTLQAMLFPQPPDWNPFHLTMLLSGHMLEKKIGWWHRAWS